MTRRIGTTTMTITNHEYRTYWLTRRWASEGIRSVQGRRVDDSLSPSVYIRSAAPWGTDGHFSERLGTNIFETEAEAEAHVVEAAKRKVASLEEQAARIRERWLS
jgi:hypothetical protein